MKRRFRGLLAGLVLGASAVAAPTPSGADVTVVSGGAFGHYSNVSLFGGPSIPVGPLPDVRLPPGGAPQPLTAREAAGSAVYGPARIFAGVWPPDVDVAPPSGPTTVTTRGTTGARGSVTSTVDIVLRTPPDPKSPGGFGPLPPTQGDELHSTCTATETGVTGSTRFVNAVMSKATTAEGEPLDEERIPDNPPPNYTRTGVLTNIGDRYRIVYNEQIVEPDGLSITVNAVHIYLLGDVAVGESIVGQVRCSARGAAFPNTPPSVAPPPDTAPSTTPEPFTGSQGAPAADESADDTSTASALPIVVGGSVLVAGVAAVLGARRRKAKKGLPRDPW